MEDPKTLQKKKVWAYLRKYTIITALVGVVIWAGAGTGISLSRVVEGFPNILAYLGRMTPPSTAILSKIGPPLVETFQIAVVAIVAAAFAAFPLSFLAAKNFSPAGFICRGMKAGFGALRGVPPLLYGLLLVAMIGLGPFAGVIALTLHCTGSLGRYFSEAVENIDPDKLFLAKSVGANKIKTLLYVILPEVRILFIGYIIYYFESNIRDSAILGVVGAGGIGTQLLMAIHLFRYKETAMLLIVIISVIVTVEVLGTQVRSRLIKGVS